MTSAWNAAGVAALLGGVVGGATVHLLRGGGSAKTESAESRQERASLEEGQADASSDDESDVNERLRKLEHRLSLVSAALQSKKEAAFDGEAHKESSERGTKNEATDVADPVFEAAVLDILDREGTRKTEEQATYRKQLHQERGKRYAGELTESLQLSEEQQRAIAQAVTDYFEQMRALRDEDAENRPATRKEWREQREKMNQSTDAKLREVLGPDQYEKYKALDPEEQLGWGRRGGNARGAQAKPSAQ